MHWLNSAGKAGNKLNYSKMLDNMYILKNGKPNRKMYACNRNAKSTTSNKNYYQQKNRNLSENMSQYYKK